MILIALLAVAFIAAPAHAVFRDMWAAVYTWDGSQNTDGKPVLTKLESGFAFQVLQAGTTTEETLYEYGKNSFTSLTNPVNGTAVADATKMKKAGLVSFRVDPGETNDIYVDVRLVVFDGGFSVFVENMTENVHTIVVDARPNQVHHGFVWYKLGSPTTTYPNEGSVMGVTGGAEVDTGIDFKYGTVVHAVRGEVVSTHNTTTGADMIVGTDETGGTGDADGFLVDLQMSTAVWTVASLASTGAYLDDGTNYRPGGHAIYGTAEQTLSYTVASLETGVNATTSRGGWIHYWFTYTGGI